MTLPANTATPPSSLAGGDDCYRVRLTIVRPDGAIYAYADDHVAEDTLADAIDDAVAGARCLDNYFPLDTYDERSRAIFREEFRLRHLGWGRWEDDDDDATT